MGLFVKVVIARLPTFTIMASLTTELELNNQGRIGQGIERFQIQGRPLFEVGNGFRLSLADGANLRTLGHVPLPFRVHPRCEEAG
jgi:hypothetical protein